MKNKIITKVMEIGTISVMVVSTASGCGASKVEGSATVDVMTAAENGCLAAQISSMLQATTEINLAVENDEYTMTKHLTSDDGEFGEGIDVTYTFTGPVTDEKGDTYTLGPATGVSYNTQWGSVAALGDLCPTEEGTGNQDTDPDYLNWFYTPYLRDNGKNEESMVVSINSGELKFEGFSLSEEE